MRLPKPFFQLPVRFDVARLQAEVAGLPPDAWIAHPDGVPGNSAVRLISVEGGETDGLNGPMRPTRWLEAMPYARQALAGFGVVWSRSRLMRLAPGARVPEHADVAYHWHTRVRLHIPVFTRPQVRFRCDGETVHMAAGEAWVFDNWRPHDVENGGDADRIHLVADTTGTAAFWRFVYDDPPSPERWPTVVFDPADARPLLTEDAARSPVMPAAEVQLLVDDLRREVIPAGPDTHARAAGFDALLDSFVLDWRQLCALHGCDGRGRSDFTRLAEAVRAAAGPLGEGLVMRTNGAAAVLVLERRLLQHLIARARNSSEAAKPALRAHSDASPESP